MRHIIKLFFFFLFTLGIGILVGISLKTEDMKKERVKSIHVRSSDIFLILKYRGTGRTYYSQIDEGNRELLEEIKLFYLKEGDQCYLGKITRTGVYDSKDKALYIIPEYMKDVYVSPRNLDYPTSITFIIYKNGSYIETDPLVILSIDIENLTIKKYKIEL